MSALRDALRRRFKTPQEAIIALGLDAKLLEEDKPMTALSRQAAYAKGRLTQYLSHRLAQDTKLDLGPIVEPIRHKNFKTQRPVVEVAIRQLTRGKLAMDADISDLTELLDALEKDGEMTGEDDANSAVPAFMKKKDDDDDKAEDEEDDAEDARMRRADDVRKRLGRDETEEERDEREEKESAEDSRKHLGRDESEEECRDRRARDKRARDRRMGRDKKRADDARMRLGRDESEEERKEREDKERAEDRKRADDRRRARDAKRGKDEPPDFKGKPEVGEGPEPVSKEAMDAAIARARGEWQADARATQDALRFVQPWTGNINIAMDSAEDVFKHTLKTLGVKADPLWGASAMKAIIEAQPKPGAVKAREPQLATDAAAAKGFESRIPSAARIVLM